MSERESSNASAAAGRSTRLAWLVLGAALVLAVGLLCLAGTKLLGVPRHFNTGDPLLDAYLQARVEDCLLKPHVAYSLPPERWRELEQRFGGTPQFALLCSTSRRQNNGTLPVQALHLPAGLAPVAYLYDAYQQGVYDFPMVLELYQSLQVAWIANAPPTIDGNPGDLSQLAMAQSWQRRCQAIAPQHGGEARELLAKMHAVAPDEAVPCYMQALHDCALGDYVAARAALRQGNAAPRCTIPLGLVMDAAIAQARQGCALGGDPVIVGLEQFTTARGFDGFGLLYTVLLLAREAARSGDRELLNDLNQMLCRLCSAPGCTGATQVAALNAYSHLYDRISNMHDHLPPEQSDALYYYTNKAELLANIPSQMLKQSGEVMDEQNAVQNSFMYDIVDSLTVGRAMPIAFFRLSGEGFIAEQQHIEKSVLPLVREMAQFDFVSMSWRDTRN